MPPGRPTQKPRESPLRCPTCGSDSTVPSARFRSEDWSVSDCLSCHCAFVWPRPSEAELDGIYSGHGTAFELLNPHLQRARDACYRSVLRLAQEELGRTGTLLDVGCSTGAFLSVAKDAGWEPVGVELDRVAARLAEQRTALPVQVGNGAESWPGGETFDLISMNHYLEHVPQPGHEVAVAAGRLRPGGLLLIRTPNGASRIAQAFGPRWSWFTPPKHLTFFDEHSIRFSASRSGLSVRASRTWRGDGHSALVEIAIAGARGLLGPGRHRELGQLARRSRGAPAATGVRLLDSSRPIARLFSRLDDSELLVLLSKVTPASPS